MWAVSKVVYILLISFQTVKSSVNIKHIRVRFSKWLHQFKIILHIFLINKILTLILFTHRLSWKLLLIYFLIKWWFLFLFYLIAVTCGMNNVAKLDKICFWSIFTTTLLSIFLNCLISSSTNWLCEFVVYFVPRKSAYLHLYVSK